MNKLFLAVAAIVTLASCGGGQTTGYEITGKINDARTDVDGKYVYLMPYGVQGKAIDSVLVTKNAFKFKGMAASDKVCVLYFEDNGKVRTGESPAFTTVFVLQNGKMQAVLDTFSYVTGTPENDAFKTLQETISTSRKGYADLVKAIQAGDKEAEKKAYQIDSDVVSAVKKYIAENPTKLTAAKMLSDFRYEIDETEQDGIFAKADSTFKSFPGIDNMIAHLETVKKVAPGKKFTDFEMADTKGKMRKLSDYVGKGKNVVLIDFWASWCGPCMREVPHMKETYKKYHKKGFEIVGISLDNKDADWKNAIKDKKLDWVQLSDLKGWKSGGAALYGVNSIPCTYLVDKDGTILARNLLGEDLDKKLEEVLAKKTK